MSRSAATANEPAAIPGSGRIVVLHQFSPCPGDALSASPFCAKVEVFCRLFNIPFEVKNGMDVHPRTKKMPWIELRIDGSSEPPVALPDSSACLEFIAAEFGTPLSSLSLTDTATAHLLQRTLEEHVYWTVVRARWVSDHSVPFLAANYFGGSTHLFAAFVVWASGMRGTLWSQGTGRYTQAEVLARLEADCAAVSQVLAHRRPGRFLFDSELPHAVDAAVFAQLNALLKDWPGNWARSPRTATPAILAYLADVRARIGLPAEPEVSPATAELQAAA